MNCKDYQFPIFFAANQVFPKITITRVITRITVIKDMVIKDMVIKPMVINKTVITMIIINNLTGVNQTKGKGIYIRFSLIYPDLFI